MKYNGEDITYDAIGNPLSYRDSISFTWTNGRQLDSYTKGNTYVEYTYDTNGLRLTKDVGNTHYFYLYHGGKLMEETIGNKVIDYFYDANGQAILVNILDLRYAMY